MTSDAEALSSPGGKSLKKKKKKKPIEDDQVKITNENGYYKCVTKNYISSSLCNVLKKNDERMMKCCFDIIDFISCLNWHMLNLHLPI